VTLIRCGGLLLCLFGFCITLTTFCARITTICLHLPKLYLKHYWSHFFRTRCSYESCSCTYKGGDDEDDSECFAEDSFRRYVAVADSRHADEHVVEDVPVMQLVVVGVVVERVAVILQLHVPATAHGPVTYVTLIYGQDTISMLCGNILAYGVKWKIGKISFPVVLTEGNRVSVRAVNPLVHEVAKTVT